MNVIRFSFLGLFVFTMVFLSSCSPSKLLWYTSNGIMTYNRNTGQFEVLWENNGAGHVEKCDTVYIYKNEEKTTGSVPQLGF